jgi:hypothetical protein
MAAGSEAAIGAGTAIASAQATGCADAAKAQG